MTIHHIPKSVICRCGWKDLQPLRVSCNSKMTDYRTEIWIQGIPAMSLRLGWHNEGQV